MKIKNNVKHFNVIYVLVVFLFFALMPIITISSTAEGEYQISTEQQLKDWLQNSNNVQTNNPNAILMTNITLNWGGVAPSATSISQGSILDGKNNTIFFSNTDSRVGENEDNRSYYALLVSTIYGTLKNTNFELVNNLKITIDRDAGRNNEGIFSGIVSAKIENGVVENCSIIVDKNFSYFNEDLTTPDIYRTSNHFGILSGRLDGSTLIKNVTVKQTQNSTIIIDADQNGDNYMRVGLIASDAYKNGNGTPQIKDVTLERWGYLEIYNSNTYTNGNCIYGIIVADMSTESTNDTNHAINIDGVIYNGVGGGVTNQIIYEKDIGGSNWHHTYFIGRIGNTNPHANYTIKNVYSHVSFSEENLIIEDTGVSVIPEGYTFSFDPSSEGNVIITKNNANDTDFIYSISQAEMGTTYDTYLQLSSSVSLGKFDTSRDKGLDTITILDGTKIENASFGFQYSEVIYNGFAYGAIFKVNDQIITDGFTVSYTNNVNSTITNGGQKATCSLDHPDIESGIFLHSTRYYVDNNKIDYLNLEMTINQAPLTLTYTGSNVYDNNLAINGLVNDQEKLTIDGNTYTNGNYQFDCVNNNTLKTIEFIDNIIKTNYLISYKGIENDQFTVNPKVITVDQGITITNANDPSKVVFEDNMLTIYSKDYQTIQLNFNQNEGYLNQVTIETINETNYKIENSISGTTLTYNITPKVNNDFKYIEKLTLVETLTKVALKFEVNDKSLLSTLKVNNENVYKFGQYFVYDCNYNEQAVISLSLIDSEEQYNIEVLVNGEPISAIEGNYSITVKGDENYIMNIIINITTV